MDRPFIVRRRLSVLLVLDRDGIRLGRQGTLFWLYRLLFREQRLGIVHQHWFNDGIRGRRLREYGFFLTTRRRHACLFVLVVGIARRAARLLHVVIDHRYDHVVRNATLARTVVVQDVTEPKPALLHQTPPEPYPFRRDRIKGGRESLLRKPQIPNIKSRSTDPKICRDRSHYLDF